tara:strand:- start:343 stop:789 length:447 start_codon:yes stop_codon:yes gene_type:complete
LFGTIFNYFGEEDAESAETSFDKAQSSGRSAISVPGNSQPGSAVNTNTQKLDAELTASQSKRRRNESKRWLVPSMEDGLLEVVGITSGFHMGVITMMLSTGIRLAQVGGHVFLKPLESAKRFEKPISLQSLSTEKRKCVLYIAILYIL